MYAAEFTVTRSGQYELQVSHGEGDSRVPLPGSAFRVAIAPAATDVPSCMRLFVTERDEFGHGDGEPLPTSTAGRAGSFYFLARDGYNNARGVGGDVFSATLHGPEMVHAEVIDQGDGAYEVRYCPRKAGEYLVAVTKGTAHIAGSSFALSVRPAPTHMPSCVAHGAALQLGEAGERQSFVVEAHYTYFNLPAIPAMLAVPTILIVPTIPIVPTILIVPTARTASTMQYVQ